MIPNFTSLLPQFTSPSTLLMPSATQETTSDVMWALNTPKNATMLTWIECQCLHLPERLRHTRQRAVVEVG